MKRALPHLNQTMSLLDNFLLGVGPEAEDLAFLEGSDD